MKYRKTTLKNGLKLITAPLKETKAVTVLVLLPVGSRFETPAINGVSHFIEHMMFKGTKRRPNTLAISKELDGVGASFNAFTGKDHTGYYVKIYEEKAELALDILSDMLFCSKFEAKEIKREKGVILEEIKMYEDNPLMYIEDLFEQTIFAGDSLGRSIAGPKEAIKKITPKEMLAYKNDFYQPANMLLTVAGNFEEEKILTLVKKYFGRHPSKSPIDFQKLQKEVRKVPLKTDQKKPRLKIRYQKTEQVQMSLGFPCYSHFHPDLYALNLLSIILGGNMSSRLFIQVREKRGLAYSVSAGAGSYQDTGSFAVDAGLNQKRLNEAIKVIVNELKKVKNKGVTTVELRRAKDFLHGKMILALEDSARVAGWFANQELLTGQILTLEQKLEKINRVTLSDVKRVANEIMESRRLNLALIGPFKDKAPFEKLLKLKL